MKSNSDSVRKATHSSKRNHVISNKASGGESDEEAFTTKGFKRHFTRHNYHDYGRVTENQLDRERPRDPENRKLSRGGVHNPFPTVLHKMMTDSDRQNFSHLISWQPHGRAFLIHNSTEFVSSVLPRYFKHSKLSSFQRQLSLYGFVRLTQDGPDKGAYYHELFLRGKAFLCKRISRTRVKGTWVRTSSSPESEPKFLEMDPIDEYGRVPRQQASPLATTTVDCRNGTVASIVSDEGDDEKSMSSSEEVAVSQRKSSSSSFHMQPTGLSCKIVGNEIDCISSFPSAKLDGNWIELVESNPPQNSLLYWMVGQQHYLSRSLDDPKSKVPENDVPLKTGLGTAGPIFDEDDIDLASFLGDVDLEGIDNLSFWDNASNRV